MLLLACVQKVYRKDLEQEVRGRGLSGIGLEETPELLRVKNANQILNEVIHTRMFKMQMFSR